MKIKIAIVLQPLNFTNFHRLPLIIFIMYSVTIIGFREASIVTQIKILATNGYDAVQIGYRCVRDKKLTKPETGHLQKTGVIPMRHRQEFRLTSVEGLDKIFKEGDIVDVAGTTIGKGFQGVIKRHHFKRVQMTHGSKSHRALGSIVAGTTPGRVYKGRKIWAVRRFLWAVNKKKMDLCLHFNSLGNFFTLP